MFRLYSEWDIDESNIVFVSKDAVMRWLRDNKEVLKIADEDGTDVDTCIASCFEQNYFSLETVEIVQ